MTVSIIMDNLNNLQASVLLYAFMWLFIICSGAWITLTMIASGRGVAKINFGFGPAILSTKGPTTVSLRLFPMGAYASQPESDEAKPTPYPVGVRLACDAGNMIMPFIVMTLAIGPSHGFRLLESVTLNFIPATLSPLSQGSEAFRHFWITLKSTPALGLAQLASTYVLVGILSSILNLISTHDENDRTIVGKIRANLVFVSLALFFPWLVALVVAFF